MPGSFGNLFGESPIAPIREHMQRVQETVRLLCELFDTSDTATGELGELITESVGGLGRPGEPCSQVGDQLDLLLAR